MLPPIPRITDRSLPLALPPALLLATALSVASARAAEVFRQDFESSPAVAAYSDAAAPGPGQFNDIGAEADAGQWSIDVRGRLRLARRGIQSANNGAGFIRHTDLPGPPGLLHARFDFGAILDSSQGDAATFDFGRFTATTDYNASSVANNVFLRLAIDAAGRRSEAFRFETSGVHSERHAADGRLYQLHILMNQSAARADYRGLDGTPRDIDPGHASVWVDGVCIFDNVAATNGPGSALTGLRVRMSGADDGVYLFDNFVFDRELPPLGWGRIRLRPDMLLADSAPDAARLLDEQEAPGPLLVTASAGPLPAIDWSALPRPSSRPGVPTGAAGPWVAVLDLEEDHELSHVCLHLEKDAGKITVYQGNPYEWRELVQTGPGGAEGGWLRLPVSATTRFLRVVAPAGGATPGELLLYGRVVGLPSIH